MRLVDFGFRKGINEVIVITFDRDGRINTAPIGIIVEDEKGLNAKARIYESHTRKNVENGSRFFTNTTYDPIVFAISSFDDLDEEYFESLDPPIIKNSLVWCEFKAEIKGDFVNLRLLDGEILRGCIRAVNRGFNALIEALVCATKYRAIRDYKMLKEIDRYRVIVEKCGSDDEKRAFETMMEYLSKDLSMVDG